MVKSRAPSPHSTNISPFKNGPNKKSTEKSVTKGKLKENL